MRHKRIITLFILSLALIVFLLVQLPSIDKLASRVQAAPITSSDGAVRFVVTGDSRDDGSGSGVNTDILAEIVQATIDEGANFILFPGDLVYGSPDPATLQSQLATWRNTMQPLYDAGIGVYPVRGNHDIGSKIAWDNVFTGTYALPGNGPLGEENITFSFTYDNVFIVGLDQYGSHLHQVNQPWLEVQFALNTQPHVFVFGHEPAFKVRHRDCLDDYPSDRNTFWRSIEAEDGRTYLTGHDHLYHHTRLDDGYGHPNDDLHQFIVGTAGAPLRNGWSYDGDNGPWTPQFIYHESEYGYVLVEIDGLTTTLTWKHRTKTAPGVYEYVATGDVFTYTTSLAPTELTATVVSTTQIDLSWTDNSDNETGFEIERSTDGPFIPLGTVSANATSYQDTGLDTETKYCYRVRAINATGQSAFTNVACTEFTAYIDLNAQTEDNNQPNVLALVPRCVYPCTPPPVLLDPSTEWILKDFDTGAPLPVTMKVAMDVQYATNNGTDSNPGTDAGQLFGGIVDGVGGYEVKVPDDYLTVAFNNLNPNKEYIVALSYNRDKVPYTDRFTKVTISGADTYTNASSDGVVVNSEDAVSFCTGYNTVNGYVAKWTGVTAADGSFSVKAEQDKSQPEMQGSKGYAMTTIMLQEARGEPPPEPPNPPTDLTATTISATQIDLAWTDNSDNETNFEIEHSTSGVGGPFSPLSTVPADTTSYQDAELDAETGYCYRVRAVNTGGQSAYTNIACATTLVLPPNAPTNLTAMTTSITQIDLSWTDNSDNETGFEIEHSANGVGGPFSPLSTVPADTASYQDTELDAGTEYCYRVCAANVAGQSAFTNVKCATTLAGTYSTYLPVILKTY